MLSYGDGLAMAVLLLTTAGLGPAMVGKSWLLQPILLTGLTNQFHVNQKENVRLGYGDELAMAYPFRLRRT